MKNNLISTCFALILFSQLANAQIAENWSVGLGFQPFLYWKYNKSDWNNRPLSHPESPNQFNGWAGALTATRSISDNWGLGAELAFSRQRQTYNTLVITVSEPDNSETYYYAKGAFTRLDYLKVPVYAFYDLEVGYESGFFLRLMGGAQVSLNTDYYSEYKDFYFDSPKRLVVPDSIENTIIHEPSNLFQDYVEPAGTHKIYTQDTKYLYNRFEFGVLAGLSLRKKIFDHYSVSLGVRYELGLTDIENPKVDKHILTFNGLTGSPGLPDPRPATHNRRFMLDIGVSRTIE
jgi:hypothetical protein